MLKAGNFKGKGKLVQQMKSKDDFQTYYLKVIDVLSKMSETDKDVWILKQACKISSDKQREFLEDLKRITEDRKEEEKARRENPDLKEFWDEIQYEIDSLSHEAYIDDQVQIEVIWDLAEKVVGYLKKNEESWGLRFQILKEIVDNEYYDYYGVFDPMQDLIKALCKSDDEWLELAEYMEKSSPYMAKDAAEIFRDHGHIEKYVTYLEHNLGREKAPYLDLISYYHANKNDEKAAVIAREGLEKCKQDQTDILLFLIRYAQALENEDEVEKLILRGRRRRLVNTEKIVAAYEDMNALDRWKTGELA